MSKSAEEVEKKADPKYPPDTDPVDFDPDDEEEELTERAACKKNTNERN